MKRFLVVILSLVAGVPLIALGAPRLIAAFVMFPSGPVLEKIQSLQPVEMEDLEILISSQRRGLSWSQSGRKWTDLGLAQILMSEKKDPSDPERLWLINDAIESLKTGLAMAPASPFAWTRLAYAETMKAGPSPGALSAFRFGLVMAPYEPHLALARISLGFAIWPELQPADKRMIFEQVRFAWKNWKERKRLVEFAMQAGRANLVRAALLRTPDDLTAFERQLRKLSR